MARLPRHDLAGIPQHVVQRGNNRLPCFLGDEDRQRYQNGVRFTYPDGKKVRKRCQGQFLIVSRGVV